MNIVQSVDPRGSGAQSAEVAELWTYSIHNEKKWPCIEMKTLKHDFVHFERGNNRFFLLQVKS